MKLVGDRWVYGALSDVFAEVTALLRRCRLHREVEAVGGVHGVLETVLEVILDGVSRGPDDVRQYCLLRRGETAEHPVLRAPPLGRPTYADLEAREVRADSFDDVGYAALPASATVLFVPELSER